jgi:hypothetical protein
MFYATESLIWGQWANNAEEAAEAPNAATDTATDTATDAATDIETDVTPSLVARINVST